MTDQRNFSPVRLKKLQKRIYVNIILALVAISVATTSASADDAAVDDNSPLFKTTPLDGYFKFKHELYEDTGFSWLLKYSQMGVKRTDAGKDKSFTGQTDVILFKEAFEKKGMFAFYYMDVQQVSGISTTEFGNRNGNITPITDSDKVSLLRQLWYQHKFMNDKLDIMVGRTEPLLAFVGGNRFAFDDRLNFQVLPMSTAAAKDRVATSPGVIIGFHPKPWLDLNVSVNELDDSAAGNQPAKSGVYYNIVNATFKVNSDKWGEGNYRFSVINSERQGQFKETYGVIISIDQDISENWGVFLRYDDTEFQTLTSALSQSNSFGFYNSNPFSRSMDDFGIGIFRTKSDQGGSFKETGGEAFYRLRITDWMRASVTVQYFNPAKAQDSFFNIGARVLFEF